MASYRDYLRRVPSFIPRLSLWHDLVITEVQPRAVATTFLESVMYLLSIPIAEGIEYLHDIQTLPVLLRLP
jgi:hypothetical protein